jgi:hypothetical protein
MFYPLYSAQPGTGWGRLSVQWTVSLVHDYDRGKDKMEQMLLGERILLAGSGCLMV